MNRRRVLQLTSVVASSSIAGCTDVVMNGLGDEPRTFRIRNGTEESRHIDVLMRDESSQDIVFDDYFNLDSNIPSETREITADGDVLVKVTVDDGPTQTLTWEEVRCGDVTFELLVRSETVIQPLTSHCG